MKDGEYMKKICVFTSITGNYDSLIEVPNKEENIDYYCITNNKNLKSETWKMIYTKEDNYTDIELSRKIKMLGEDYIPKTYDYYMYIDGNLYFKKNIHEFFEKYIFNHQENFYAFKHSERDCAYDEITACLQLKKETKENLLKTKEMLISENYPKHTGLIEATVFIKNKDKLVRKTMEKWFESFKAYAKRDQLTFNYCAFKTKMPIGYIDLNVWKNEWFGFYPHAISKQRLDNFRIYFGDSNSFEIEKCIDGQYTKMKDSYVLNVQSPIDTEVIEFTISEKNILLESIKLNSKKVSYDAKNAFKIGDKVYFIGQALLIFKKQFKKKDIIKIEVQFREIENIEISGLFKDYIKKEQRIKTLENVIENKEQELKDKEKERLRLEKEFKKTNEALTKILESKSWKLISKLRKVNDFVSNRKEE